MIADDEVFFRTVLREMLTKGGYTIAGEAKNGIEAVEMAKELKPDIVLLDVVMPKMNGLDAAKTITSSGLNLHVIMLSSIGHGTVVNEAMAAGASAYITKPPKETEVLSTLKKLFTEDK